MTMNGMTCSACGYDAGESRYWWPLELRVWLHDIIGGRAHKQLVQRWNELYRNGHAE